VVAVVVLALVLVMLDTDKVVLLLVVLVGLVLLFLIQRLEMHSQELLEQLQQMDGDIRVVIILHMVAVVAVLEELLHKV